MLRFRVAMLVLLALYTKYTLIFIMNTNNTVHKSSNTNTTFQFSKNTNTKSEYHIPTNTTVKLINTIVSMWRKILINSQYRYTPLLPLSNELTETAQYRVQCKRQQYSIVVHKIIQTYNYTVFKGVQYCSAVFKAAQITL